MYLCNGTLPQTPSGSATVFSMHIRMPLHVCTHACVCEPGFLCMFTSTLSQVRTYDQVMFESVKTEGQFLHCSVRFFEYIRQHLHSEW